MKYVYKKQMKKLLMLFLFLPAVLAAVAQVPGTPYGVTALTCAAAPATPGTITLSGTTVLLNGTFTASITAVSGATSYVWTLPAGLTGTSTTNSITITGATAAIYAAGTIQVAAKNDCGTSATKNSTSAVSVVTNPGALPEGSGRFAGRACFDVALGNSGDCGVLASRQADPLTANGARADFTDPITRNQTYTFTPSGTVSNVRFEYVESGTYTGQIIQSISGGNSGNNISAAVSCNIVYKSDLNGQASGKTNAGALTVDIYAVYNDKGDGTGKDVRKMLSVVIKDCACCGATTMSGTWLNFMCYNLGADPTLITPDQISNAEKSRTSGSLYQWGSNIAWPSTGNVTGMSQYPPNPQISAWWHYPDKGPEDPCPAGWRVPSYASWRSLFDGTNGTILHGAAVANTVAWNSKGYLSSGLRIGQYLYLPDVAERAADGTLGSLPGPTTLRHYHTSGGTYNPASNEIVVIYHMSFHTTQLRVVGVGAHHNDVALPVRCVEE
jgi:uncharacterized protein (TIGR02145 family)